MNKTKTALATTSRLIVSTLMVVAMVALAGLVGVGGAALWIYSRTDAAPSAATSNGPRVKVGLVADDARVMPRLSAVPSDDEVPSQLIPAHYVPSESEIATFSDAPRYTYVSYDGGRQRAHVKVNTVVSTALTPDAVSDGTTGPVPRIERPSLSDSASHYITNAEGRVIGIDGTASAAAEGRELSVQPKGLEPEVRVASPVLVRRATAVDENTAAPSDAFSVQEELSREDAAPALKAQPIAQKAGHVSMFGASDDIRLLGRN